MQILKKIYKGKTLRQIYQKLLKGTYLFRHIVTDSPVTMNRSLLLGEGRILFINEGDSANAVPHYHKLRTRVTYI